MIPKEHAGLYCGRLEEILLTHGERGAERFLGRTLEDVAVRLSRVERCWQRGEVGALRRTARALSEAAGQIGLTTLSRVALDVSQVTWRNDPAALAATVSRLVRVGEASLMRIWDIRDETV
ncbi:hypothetical protein [Ovoidimarina sediminis]|uniref:hypothetical protein n=1 Tax=Ovoidimarina sediminis TaxID=3079856 RepID=UPI00292EDC1B|nr:hypothetical protein [Rhodophyticola sp. MJ-SS7]